MISILQHVPFETPGAIETWLEENNIGYAVSPVYKGVPLPDVNECSGLIILGGSMNVYEEKQFDWLSNEKTFIREFAAAGKKILGICLGAQLLAHSLGASVKRNPALEIGWFPVKIDTDKLPERLQGVFPEEFQSFHWHGDTFEIPAGASGFAHSEGCANQAFLLNDHVLGLQFHPEMTETGLEDLLLNCSEDLLSESVFVQGGEEIHNGKIYLQENHLILNKLLNAFFH